MRTRWTAPFARFGAIAGAGTFVVLAWVFLLGRSAVRPSGPDAMRRDTAPGVGRTVAADGNVADGTETLAGRPLVRVLIERASEEIELFAARPCRVVVANAGNGRAVAVAGELGRIATGQRVTVSAREPVGLRCGGWVTERSTLVIRPEPFAAPGVWVGERLYRGEIRVFRGPGRELTIVNAVPLELYVATVVDSEMPASFPAPARRAQAIVARTYVLSRMVEARGHPHFDVYDDARSQRYLGFQYRLGERRLAGETAAGRAAASQTRGVVCVTGGKLLRTYYSAVCGGRTTRGAAVFRDAAELRSVDCDWCRPAALYQWRRRIEAAALQQQLKSWPQWQGVSGELRDLQVADPQHVTDRQAVPTVRVRTTGNVLMVSASEFRRLVEPALPSPFFLVRRQENAFVFDGHGSGHGVGLCQWGAAGLAKAGRTTRQILSYYYPVAELVRLAW